MFLVGVCESRFPSHTGRARSGPTSPGRAADARCVATQRDLPSAAGSRQARRSTALPRAHQAARGHDEELRLGYVAFTRARHTLVGLVVPLEADAQDAVRPVAVPAAGPRPPRRVGRGAARRWRDKPAKGDAQPAAPRPSREPVAGHRADRRGTAAAGRRRARTRATSTRPSRRTTSLDLVRRRRRGRLGRRARAAARRGPAPSSRQVVDVPLPASLSATALARLRDDPETFAARAGPTDAAAARRRRPGSAPGSTPGSSRASASSDLIDPDELPGRADAGIDDDDDLRELIEAFEQGPFARPATPHAVEAPFALVLAGQVVRGRIDAVYRDDADDGALAGRRLEDHARRDRRPAPARALPARLGRARRACRSSGCARRSTTCAPDTWSSRRTCPTVRRSRGWARDDPVQPIDRGGRQCR